MSDLSPTSGSNDMGFEDLTLCFIEKAEGSDLISGIVQQSDGKLDEFGALRWTVQVQASPQHMPPNQRTPGRETQWLTDWHRFAANMCSDSYEDLTLQYPTLSRDQIRQLPELRRLNAVRMGIRAAMNQQHSRTASRMHRH